jgi:hypothetical protein
MSGLFHLNVRGITFVSIQRKTAKWIRTGIGNNKRASTNTCTHKNVHAQTCAHTNMCTHKHVHTQTCAHTNMYKSRWRGEVEIVMILTVRQERNIHIKCQTRCNTILILLQDHSTCFGYFPYPSSIVQNCS